MATEPGFAQLVDWLEGRRSLDEESEAQIAEDEALAKEMAWIRKFHEIRAEVVWAAPPAGVRAELRRRFVAQAAENRTPGLWQRITAVLKFDSQTQPVLAGVRTSSTLVDRQLVFNTAQADVALTIQSPPPAQAFTLFGQILPTTAEMEMNYSVQLFRDGRECAFSVVTGSEDFMLDAISAGVYELVLQSDRYEIVLPLQIE